MVQIICPISGIKWAQAPYMSGIQLADKHPIFRMKRRDLVTTKLIHSFNKAEALEEKRLYFLGALYATDLVQFHCIAEPSLKTIENNFVDVCKISWWIDYAYYQGVSKENPLPRYAVRSSNKEMDNIRQAFIDPINELREAYDKKEQNREKSKRDREEVERVFKELNDAFKKDRFFTPYTVDWIIDYCSLHKHPRINIFREILLMKQDVIWAADRNFLEEIHEAIFSSLDHNHPAYAPIMGQLNRLIGKQKEGYTSFEIVEQPSSFVDDEGNEQVKMINTKEAYQEKMIKTYGSNEEPKLEDFKDRLSWLKAVAIWGLANGRGPSSLGKNKGNSGKI